MFKAGLKAGLATLGVIAVSVAMGFGIARLPIVTYSIIGVIVLGAFWYMFYTMFKGN